MISVQTQNSTPLPTLDEVRRLVATGFPQRSVVGFEALSGGFCNTNLKVFFASDPKPAVLRIYRRRPSPCLKEVELLHLVQQTVPVPEVFHVEPEGLDESGPFALLEYIEGITFQQLEKTGDLQAIQEASYSVGQTLAAIGRYQFEKPGRLVVTKTSPGRESDGLSRKAPYPFSDTQQALEVGLPYIDGPDPIPRMLDSFLALPNLQRRTGPALADRLHDFVWEWAPRLPSLDEERSLAHSDFGARNILVRQIGGSWEVAAVIDWEFAFSGSPLLDVGNFLRYERAARPMREPWFSRGFLENGGSLPDDWRHVVRLLDLAALCEMLTRDTQPDEIVIELLDLIQATLEDRDLIQ